MMESGKWNDGKLGIEMIGHKRNCNSDIFLKVD